jgi:hypothetical protein
MSPNLEQTKKDKEAMLKLVLRVQSPAKAVKSTFSLLSALESYIQNELPKVLDSTVLARQMCWKKGSPSSSHTSSTR